MFSMKALATLLLTALVLASSLAVVADSVQAAPGQGQGGDKKGGNEENQPEDRGDQGKGDQEETAAPGDRGQGGGGSDDGEPGPSGDEGNGNGQGQGSQDDHGRDAADAQTGPGAERGGRDDPGRPSETTPSENGGSAGRDPRSDDGSTDRGPQDGGAPGSSEDAPGRDGRQDPAPRDEGPGVASGPQRPEPATPTEDRREPEEAAPPGRGDRGEDGAPRRRPAPTPDQSEIQAPLDDEDVEDGTTARGQDASDTPPLAVVDEAGGFRTAPRRGGTAPTIGYDAGTAALTVQGPTAAPVFTSRITGLVEYLDADGNGAYDLGEEILQHVTVDGIEPDIFIGFEDDDTRDVVYALPGGGTLTLIFHLGDGGQAGAKYDILVTDFAFLDADSRLAVGASAETLGGVQIVSIDGSPAVAGVGDSDVGYLSWVTEAVVDGIVAPVGWSVHLSRSETSEAAMIYWSYPQGVRILHDPQVGFIDLPPELLGDAELFVYGLVATGTVLLVGHELRRRRHW